MVSTNNRNKHLTAFSAGVKKSVDDKKKTTADITPYILGHTGPQTGNLEKIKAAGKGLFIAKPQFTKEESHLLNKFAQAFDAHSRAIKAQNPNNYTFHQTKLIQDAHLKAHMLGAFIEHALGTQNPVGRSLLLKVKPEYIEKVGDDVTIKGGFGPQPQPQPSVAAPAASPAPNDVKDVVRPEVVPGVQQGTIDSTKPESEEAQTEDKKNAEGSPQGGENPAVADKGTGDVTLGDSNSPFEHVLDPAEKPSPLGEGFEPIDEVSPVNKAMQIEETATGQPARPTTPEQPIDPLKGKQKQKKPKPKAEVLSDIPIPPIQEEHPGIFIALEDIKKEHDRKRLIDQQALNDFIQIYNEDENITPEIKQQIIAFLKALIASNEEAV